MSIFKQITFVIAQFVLCAFCFSQSEKIDSLKKILPLLKESARVDCLNALSEAYIGLPDWYSTPTTKSQFDTGEIFAIQAEEEAKKINYTYGMAKALSLKAEIAFDEYNNYTEAERLDREAIDFYKKTTKKKGLNRTYWRLATALYAESKFNAAINTYDTSNNLSKREGDSVYVFYIAVCVAYVYLDCGNYTKAFEKVEDLHQLNINSQNRQWKAWEFDVIGELYASLGDFTTALKYYQQEFRITGPDNNALGEIFALNKQFDSATYYYNLVDTSDQRGLRFYLANTGECYFFKKNMIKRCQIYYAA